MRGINEGQDVVIVVALEDISIREMNTTLASLRRSSTWLDFWEVADNPEEELVMWVRLRDAIRYPSDQPTRCLCGKTYYPDGTCA